MRTLLFLIAVLILISGCSFSFNFQSNRNLKNDYEYSQKARDLDIFYNVEEIGNSKKVSMNIKNISGLYIAGMNIDIISEDTKNNISIGNIKNLSSKKYTIEVNKKADSVTIEYTYSLIPEDSFLNPTQAQSTTQQKNEKIVLYLK